MSRRLYFLLAGAALSVVCFGVLGDRAAAVPCNVSSATTNIFPRDSLGSREDNGCAPADSYLWLSDYNSGSEPETPLQTPYHRLRVFYPMTYVNSFASPGSQIDQVNFYSPDETRVTCGVSVTATYLQTGESITWQKGPGCTWPRFLGFIPGSFAVLRNHIQQDGARYGVAVGYVDIDLQMTSNNTAMPVKVWATQPGSQAKITFREQTIGDAQANQPSPNPDGTNAGGGDGAIGPDGGAIAIWTNGSGRERISYNLNFAPDCTIAPGTRSTIYLKWYDADADYPGNATQSSGFGWEVIDDTTGTVVATLFDDPDLTTRVAELGGNDSYRTRALTIDGGHRYRWRWSGINRNNGIQIWMPFSEINAENTCASVSVECSVDNISGIEPGVAFAPVVRVSHTGDAGSPPTGFNATMTINSTGYSQTISGTVTQGATTAVTFPNATLAAGLQTLTGQVSGTGFPMATCTRDVRTAYRPYFKVFGEARVGGCFASSSDPSGCFPPAGAGQIRGYTASDRFAGAASSFAVFALSNIEGFFSNADSGLGAGGSGISLTFANTGVVTGRAQGGSLGGMHFIKDFYETTQRPGQVPVMPGAATASWASVYAARNPDSNQVMVNGNFSPSGPLSLGAGQRLTVYVDGNVYLNGNIGLATSYASATDIPFFALVVRGNVFISPNVTNLDGIYIAQPTASGGRGVIYTCAAGLNSFYPTTGASSLYNSCTRQLTFNGYVVAKGMKLLRTQGTLSGAAVHEPATSGNIAEVFNSLPELLMAEPAFRDDAAGTLYDSVTNLPPFL